MNRRTAATTKTLPENEQPGSVQLRRELGLFSAINLILAVMIGSGIFVSPGIALQHSGSVGMCVLIWTICGIVSLMGALAFAELGTVIPRSGAEYAYFMDSFGPLHKFWGPLSSFLVAWVMIFLIRPAEVAVIIMTFGEYLSQPITDYLCIRDLVIAERVTKLIALVALGIITYINMASVKLYVKVQNVIVGFKLIACFVVILGGVYQLAIGNTHNLSKGFEGTKYDGQNMALAFYSGLWAYDGWSTVTTVTEEIKRPEVNIPRSIAISVPIVTALYVFMNVAYMTVLPFDDMVNARAVAVTFEERITGYPAFLIPIGVAIATFGCALGVQFGVTRLCYVAAQDGFMAESMAYVNYKKMTPAPAVFVQGFITFLFIIMGSIVELIEFASFLIWIFYGIAMISVLVLRKTMAHVHRPYKVPIVIPVIVFVVAVFLSVTPIVMDPSIKYLFSVFYIILGIIVYYFCCYKKKQPERLMRGLTYFVQVMFEAAPPTAE